MELRNCLEQALRCPSKKRNGRQRHSNCLSWGITFRPQRWSRINFSWLAKFSSNCWCFCWMWRSSLAIHVRNCQSCPEASQWLRHFNPKHQVVYGACIKHTACNVGDTITYNGFLVNGIVNAQRIKRVLLSWFPSG